MVQKEAEKLWSHEHDAVLRWRRDELLRAGCDESAARLLAETPVDLHAAVELVRSGCPAETALRILA